MVEELGKIIESRDGIVLIETVLQDGCESCTAKPLCHGEEGSDAKRVEAYNPVHAEVGDTVVFQVPGATILKAGAAAYLYPLIALVVGVLFGQYLGERFFSNLDKELIGFAMGMLFVVASYGITKAVTTAAGSGKEHRPVVVKVVS